MQYVNYNTTCKKSLENRLALQVCIKTGMEGNYQGLEIKAKLTCTDTSIPLKLHIIYTFKLKGFRIFFEGIAKKINWLALCQKMLPNNLQQNTFILNKKSGYQERWIPLFIFYLTITVLKTAARKRSHCDLVQLKQSSGNYQRIHKK